MALEIHSSQSLTIPSLIQRKLRCLIPSQRFLLFGLKPGPGDQHCDFVISCVMCGGGRTGREPERKPCWNRGSPESGAAWLGGSMAEPDWDPLAFILFFIVKMY